LAGGYRFGLEGLTETVLGRINNGNEKHNREDASWGMPPGVTKNEELWHQEHLKQVTNTEGVVGTLSLFFTNWLKTSRNRETKRKQPVRSGDVVKTKVFQRLLTAKL